MNLTAEKKKVQAAVSRCARYCAKGLGHDWDRLGEYTRQLAQQAYDRADKSELTYSQQCNLYKSITDTLEEVYYSYFRVGINAYDYVHGNEKWKRLVQEHKDKLNKKK